ncbi:hypothetical protein [Rhabdaerophilum sp. SD176]|uniref:hypothetical protein n=1 Tax=Rhabdaerophilum sp. SD176 TaxID=2983548 RepID=UPI0024DFCB6D|nr:hypothetical protein [Rhabdaerophilum sp. SD176]
MTLIYVAVHKMSRNYFALHHAHLTWINGSGAWLAVKGLAATGLGSTRQKLAQP